MNILLDTHALIWFINGDNQLSNKGIDLIKNIHNNCFVSIASIWEIAIKVSLNKLELHRGFDHIAKLMSKFNIELLPLNFEHIRELIKLEFHHRDPFDRIIISQAISEKLPILTRDHSFKLYPIEIIWD
jgi:PIN domain nuclease of toxin-antitoxin system